MRKLLAATAGLVLGCIAGAFGGGLMISLLSANMHDRSLEAATTGAFVTGPFGALLGLVVGLMWAREGKARPPQRGT